MIIEMASEGGLVLGTDYEKGDSFIVGGKIFYTAKLLGDPISKTIRVIDKLGFYTQAPHARWTYIAIPYQTWLSLTYSQKLYVISFMYGQEGGTTMKNLFAEQISNIGIGVGSALPPLGDKVG